MKPHSVHGSFKNRRQFMKQSAALGLALATRTIDAEEISKNPLPMIRLGQHRISRLIVGSNPMLGYSHFNPLLSRLMEDYFTVDKTAEFLLHCETVGINAFQSSYDEKLDQALRRYRDRGGQMHWICLANGNQLTDETVLARIVKDHRPIAVAHHGWQTDKQYRRGTLDTVNDFVKRAQDHGVLAGISTHNPLILKEVEAKGWGHDFTMASFHFISRSAEEVKEKLGHLPVPRNEVYLEEDPPAMCAAVREGSRPTLVYKILAAGRYCGSAEQVEDRFQFAFQNIKPSDAVIVGMFPQYEDQAALNAALTRKYAG